MMDKPLDDLRPVTDQGGIRPKLPTVKFEGRKIGRNERCPCGSGKKFKKCHLLKGMRGVK